MLCGKETGFVFDSPAAEAAESSSEDIDSTYKAAFGEEHGTMKDLSREKNKDFSFQSKKNKKKLRSQLLLGTAGTVALAVFSGSTGMAFGSGRSMVQISGSTAASQEQMETTADTAYSADVNQVKLVSGNQSAEPPVAYLSETLAAKADEPEENDSAKEDAPRSSHSVDDSRKLDSIAMKLIQMDERQGTFGEQLAKLMAVFTVQNQSSSDSSDLDEKLAAIAENYLALSEKIDGLALSFSAGQSAEAESESPQASEETRSKLDVLSEGITTNFEELFTQIEELKTALDTRESDSPAADSASQDEKLDSLTEQVQAIGEKLDQMGTAETQTEPEAVPEGEDVSKLFAALDKKLSALTESLESGKDLSQVTEEIQSVGAQVGTLGEKLDTLGETLDTLDATEEITALGEKLDTLGETLGTLDSTEEITALGEKLDTLGETLGTLDATEEITALGEKLDTLGETLDSLDTTEEITALGEKLDTLGESLATGEDLTALGEKVDNASSENQEMGASLSTKLDEVFEKLTALEETLEEKAAAIDTRFDSLESTISQTAEKLDSSTKDEELQASLDELGQLSGISESLASIAEELEDSTGTNTIKEQLDSVTEQLDDLMEVYSEMDTKVSSIADTIVPIEPETDYIDYTVADGDTMVQICMDHGVNYYEIKEELKELNHLSDLGRLSIGQVVRIPVVKNQAEIDAQKKE